MSKVPLRISVQSVHWHNYVKSFVRYAAMCKHHDLLTPIPDLDIILIGLGVEHTAGAVGAASLDRLSVIMIPGHTPLPRTPA